MRVRAGFAKATAPKTVNGLFNWASSNTTRIIAYFGSNGGLVVARQNNDGSGAVFPTTPSFNAGDLMSVVIAWDASFIYGSINGAAFTKLANTSAPALAAITTFDIGSADPYFTGSEINSDFLWFACGTGTLADADAATINGYGNNTPTFTMPGDATMIWSADTSAMVQSAGLGALTIGKIATRGGWSGLQMTASGIPINSVIQSSISTPIDISAMDNLSMVFPDYNTFDTSSTIELTSSADGSFTNSAYKSAAVAFSGNLSSMPEVRLALSSFASGAGASFTLSKITGVRFTITDTVALPTSGTKFTIMALRAIKTGWTTSALDFDTRLGALVVPVTLDGNVYAGTVAQNFEFVRGDGTKSDPIPADTAMNLYFYPGGEVANDATGTNYNKLSTILREIKDTSGGTGSHLEVSLLFNATSTNFEVKRVDSTGGSPGTTTDHGLTDILIGAPLDPTKHYLFRTEVKGTQILASIYETDSSRNVGNLVWNLATTVSDTNYVYRNGRVGFIANFITRDAYLDQIDVSPTGYASLTTEVLKQRTPVDGAQLAAIFADDENLWQSYTGSDVLIDQTKTVSGGGSYRTTLGLTSNTFVVDDWTQSYLDVDIWVPSNVTLNNQPVVLLNTATGTKRVVVPRLQPAQWNHLHFDLGIFRDLLTGIGYSFSILPATNPDKPLGNFWVDSTVIGRRRIVWSVRATPNGPFRKFRDLVNDPNGAVHFPANERGTDLQLRAEALTEDAWVSSFKVFPRHAQLGLPVYDQAFEKRA